MKQSDESSRKERERRDRAMVDETLDGIDQDLLDAVSASSYSSDELAIKADRIHREFEADAAKRRGLPVKKAPLRPVKAPMTQAQRKKAEEEAKREELIMLKNMTKEQMIAYTLEQKCGPLQSALRTVALTPFPCSPIKSSQKWSPSPSPVKPAPSKAKALDSDDSDREPDLFTLVEGAFLDRGIDYRAIEEAENQRMAELRQEREKWADVDLSAAAIALQDEDGPAPGQPFSFRILANS